jgi:hypothetical protein
LKTRRNVKKNYFRTPAGCVRVLTVAFRAAFSAIRTSRDASRWDAGILGVAICYQAMHPFGVRSQNQRQNRICFDFDFDFNIPTALKGWVGQAAKRTGALLIII